MQKITCILFNMNEWVQTKMNIKKLDASNFIPFYYPLDVKYVLCWISTYNISERNNFFPNWNICFFWRYNLHKKYQEVSYLNNSIKFFTSLMMYDNNSKWNKLKMWFFLNKYYNKRASYKWETSRGRWSWPQWYFRKPLLSENAL